MEYKETDIKGVYLLEPKLFSDERGFFFESFKDTDFNEHVEPIKFVQENESKSKRGVVRGLHFQRPPYAQSKLVRCVRGTVIDIAVDLRPNSPTYGKYVAYELSEYNHRQLFIPKGFAHGFVVISKKNATLQYKCDEYYHPESEGSINPLDTTLNIGWAFNPEELIIKDKDKNGLSFSDPEVSCIFAEKKETLWNKIKKFLKLS